MPLSSVLRAFKTRPAVPAKKIRVGLVGAGRMGQLHARVISENKFCTLAGIADTDTARRDALAKKFHAPAFAQANALLDRVDAAILALPTQFHFEVGKLFLERGIPCLIEKPLTSDVAQAEELIHLAQQRKCVLQVGHIERFNPAVMEAARYIKNPQFIEVNRLGPYDPRVQGIGVVMDLMIHDLDIVQFLVGKPVKEVEAFGAKVLSDHEDIAKVRLKFEGGCIAESSASRISINKYRRIRIFQKNGYLSLDYAAPALTVYRKKGEKLQSLRDIEIIHAKLTKREPLALELDHFLECIQQSKQPLVSGEHGRDALQLAKSVLEHLEVRE